MQTHIYKKILGIISLNLYFGITLASMYLSIKENLEKRLVPLIYTVTRSPPRLQDCIIYYWV